MKYLLYYNLDSKFVTDQTAAGGDGTNVVSVVDGVAWTKDQEKTYYRYSNNDDDIVVYTLTIQYHNKIGEAIAPNDTISLSAYSGCEIEYIALPKSINYFTPVDEHDEEIGCKKITLTGNTTYTFVYSGVFPLCFEITSSGEIVWTYSASTNQSKRIEYKKNNGKWIAITSDKGDSAPRISVSPGDVVAFRGDNKQYGIWGSENLSNCFCGTTAGFKVKGNIVSLINSTEFVDEIVCGQTFIDLFKDCTGLTDASELILPKKLANSCFYSMFYGCTNLVNPPSLPVKNLSGAGWCYSEMFAHCTSLTTAPQLPATVLDDSCYSQMFYGCTNLTVAPELPATTLGSSCYYRMFSGCTSLVNAPALPATTLSGNCYQGMFAGCTSLTNAPALPATTLSRYCYEGMFARCSSLVTAPELPATTLADHCYFNMFSKCTSLTTAPELRAKVLTNGCYIQMFGGCTNLNYIKCLATNPISDWNVSGYNVMGWMADVAQSGTFVKNPSTSENTWGRGSSGIPNGWTIQNAS